MLGIMLIRLGIAEEDECAIPQIPGNEPVKVTDGLRDTAPKIAGRLVLLLKVGTVGSCRPVNQLAGHGSDLPPLRATVEPWCGIQRDRYRRRSGAAVLRFHYYRS